jgi:hypothetical protein
MSRRSIPESALAGGIWTPYPLSTEEEMASRLGISSLELRKAIEAGSLTYSIHLKASPSGYQFAAAVVEHNTQIWKCLRAGGHTFEIDSYRDETKTQPIYKCLRCPARRY